MLLTPLKKTVTLVLNSAAALLSFVIIPLAFKVPGQNTGIKFAIGTSKKFIHKYKPEPKGEQKVDNFLSVTAGISATNKP